MGEVRDLNGDMGGGDVWKRQVADLLNGLGVDFGEQIEVDSEPPAAETEYVDENRHWRKAIGEMDRRKYGAPISYAFVETDEDGEVVSVELSMVGYSLPLDNEPSKVVAVFNDGAHFLVHAPRDRGERQQFLADFMPGGNGLILGEPKMMIPAAQQFLEQVVCGSIIRYNQADHGEQASAALTKALELAPTLTARRQEMVARNLNVAKLAVEKMVARDNSEQR